MTGKTVTWVEACNHIKQKYSASTCLPEFMWEPSMEHTPEVEAQLVANRQVHDEVLATIGASAWRSGVLDWKGRPPENLFKPLMTQDIQEFHKRVMCAYVAAYMADQWRGATKPRTQSELTLAFIKAAGLCVIAD